MTPRWRYYDKVDAHSFVSRSYVIEAVTTYDLMGVQMIQKFGFACLLGLALIAGVRFGLGSWAG